MMPGFLWMFAFPPRKKRILLIVGVIAVEGLLLGLIGHVYSLWAAVSLEFLMGLCIACNNVPMLALIQEYAAPEKLGRVMSLSSMASMGLSPISYAMVSALLSGGVSVGIILPACGLTMSLAVLLIAACSSVARKTD
jgi:MFS transporter, DHA3 family, macrolide efflux protein